MKGHETALFEKLSRKYNVPNPLETDNATSSGIESFSRGLGAPLHPPQNDSTKPGGSAQRIAAASFKSTELTSTVAPFGATPMSSFSASPTTATNSPFGSTSSSTPGFGNSPSTPFGQKTSTNSAFGQLSQPIASPFGQSSSPMGSSFGNLAGSGCRTFGGKTTREILITFYQQRNPSKISEVDKVLAKYAGNEEHLLRNLAKKYNLDPSYFGLTTTSVPVFGSTSGVGQSQPFGQTNQSSGGTAAFGSSGFASLAQSVQSNTGGFGTVPSTQASNTFSGLSNARYGSSATPFGAPRR